MKVLTSREAEIVATITETIAPREGAFGVGADEAGVVEYVDDWLSRLPLSERMKMRTLFRAVEYGYAAKAMNPRARFSTAGESERTEFLASFGRADDPLRRSLFHALRSVISMAYLRDASVMDGMGEVRAEEVSRRTIDALAEEPAQSAPLAAGADR